MRTKLSVNINKVALIRNSRGSNLPNLITFAKDCESYGAEGITVHPRPDERHVRYNDLAPLKDVVKTELNVEGYPSDKFLSEVLKIKPHQCTLVPDPPGVLTSDKGWEIIKHKSFLKEVIDALNQKGVRCSLFVDPEESQIEAAKLVGADRIELYTGDYANDYYKNKEDAVRLHVSCARRAQKVGLGVNAGHDLNLDNLAFYASAMPFLDEVSIGHAIISDALYYGIANVIGMYKNLLS